MSLKGPLLALLTVVAGFLVGCPSRGPAAPPANDGACRSASDCPSGSQCAGPADAASTSKACQYTSDCPANQHCVDQPALGKKLCFVKPCTSDSDCAGACVNRFCASAAGHCAPA